MDDTTALTQNATALLTLDIEAYTIFNWLALVALIIVLILLIKKLREDYIYHQTERSDNL